LKFETLREKRCAPSRVVNQFAGRVSKTGAQAFQKSRANKEMLERKREITARFHIIASRFSKASHQFGETQNCNKAVMPAR